MARLEPISHQQPDTYISRPAPPGRLRHARNEQAKRHRHETAYCAVVLSGNYIEAGDTGRHLVQPGDVLFHQRFEAHQHVVGSAGAEVLVIELKRVGSRIRGQVTDPDAIVRLAERQEHAALLTAVLDAKPIEHAPLDWPDLLASDIRQDPSITLETWADRHGVHPGSLSRSFRALYSVAPSRYRLVQRARKAVALINEGNAALADVAAVCGFSDQSHMSRAIKLFTGRTALQVRQSAVS